MRSYKFTVDVTKNGRRYSATYTVKQAVSMTHARCKVVIDFEAAGFTLHSFTPVPAEIHLHAAA